MDIPYPQPGPLAPPEKLAWLRLIRSEGIGPVTFAELLGRYGTATAVLDALPDLARRAGRRLRIATSADAAAEIEATERSGGRLVATVEPGYPRWLRQIDAAPPVVALRGPDAVFARPMVAIVGSRNASVAGRKIAAMLARDLGARGIDAAAQEAAIPTGTVAAFAGGLDVVYPPEHAPLAAAILADGGGIVSEAPLGLSPRARDFPRRNRIVSGLSLAVVVVEAAERSGTLITARFAGEQGRVLCAVPGSPLDPRAAGTNRLLKEGAVLVTSAEDVLAVVEPMLSAPMPPVLRLAREEAGPPLESNGEGGDHERRRVLEALGPAPIEIDAVIRFTGLSPATVQLALIELDLAGRIERHPGQRVSLV